MNLLWSLKTLPPDEAADILERIRSSDDPSAVLDSFTPDSRGSKRPRSPEARVSPASSGPSSSQTPPAKRPSYGIPTPESEIRPSDLFQASSRESAAFSLLKSPVCRDAVQYFIKCTGILFHIFTKDQGDRAFDEMLRGAESTVPRISMCEVCASAAVGSQYSHGKVSAQAGHQFYNIARHLLDDAIQVDPLRGMKVCALLAMYNIVIKGSVALAFIGMLSELYPISTCPEDIINYGREHPLQDADDVP